jgi:7-cyano-7-deazaguanine synthase
LAKAKHSIPSDESEIRNVTTIFRDLPQADPNVFDADRKHDSVAIVSGGLDSVTLVFDLVSQNYKPHILSFNYGQRHKKELTYAAMVAKRFGLKHDIADLQTITHLISNSALTSPKAVSGDMPFYELAPNKIEVPEGHYAEDNMSVTVVPNRNMIMLSIAAGVAVNNKYRSIATGVHAGDHFQYPDCRPEFIYQVSETIRTANDGFHNFGSGQAVFAPYMNLTKADIAVRAFELGVPLHMTWSCYKGGENHCGRCGTCVERLEAIAEAKAHMLRRYPSTDTVWADATVYDDEEFWKIEVAKRSNNGNH